jgi:putative FmdB family regulatory protein
MEWTLVTGLVSTSRNRFVFIESLQRNTAMPLYEYECKQCKKHTEKIQKFSDKEITECPHCGGLLERVISAAAISFKGGGWFKDGYSHAKPKSSSENDSKSKSDSTSSTDSAKSSSVSSSETSTSSSSDTKPAAAPSAPAASATSAPSAEKK